MHERERVQDLVQKYLDGAAGHEELGELDQVLGASRSAAVEMAEACRIDAFLAEHFAEERRTLEVASLLEAREPEAEAALPPRVRRRRLPLAGVAAVAAAVLIAVGALLITRATRTSDAPPHHTPMRCSVVSGHVLINGVRSRTVPHGVRIVVPSAAPAVVRLADGSRAELAPASEAIVRGPASGTREALELLEGLGRFHAARGKGQFRVETLVGSVTALGTEFTVALRAVEPRTPPSASSTRAVRVLAVAVDRGTVRVDLGSQTCMLSAGERREFTAGIRHDAVCGPPPREAEPGASADALPPLPLPLTPQRRTATKHSPEPPVVVVKLKTASPLDWATDPNDIANLLAWMRIRLPVGFACEERTLSDVALGSTRPPMLYRTGHNAFAFTQAERARLRDYVIEGGFVFFDACCGRKAFADSVRKELAAIFPARPLHKLEPDHPLYRCYYDVPSVRYTAAAGIAGAAAPPLEGIDIGCRTAIVFSPLDLSCGWDMHTHATCAGVHAEDALKLGANLIAYATATKAMGASLAESRVYTDEDPSQADKFRIGRVVHGGQWNPDPAGLSTLLDTVSATSSMKVSFATQPLRLDGGQLGSFPFLYMTGHGDFTLSLPEVVALRKYLEAGGFLLADACCGRTAFDAAFRREIQRVLPIHELSRLPATHPIYSVHYRIQQVGYSPAAATQRRLESPGPPALEGISLGGELAVVYSPLDLGCGWELKPHPYGIGYESRDAVKLGVNIVMYAVTH